jgi:hypothetical protein
MLRNDDKDDKDNVRRLARHVRNCGAEPPPRGGVVGAAFFG